MPEPAGRRNAALEADSAANQFETRFVPLKNNSVGVVLPYVLSAIETIGQGSAVGVGNLGIQLTLPQQFMNFLIFTLNTYEGTASSPSGPLALAQFPQTVFFPPVITVKGVSSSLKPAVDALGICPPDFTVEWVSLGPADGALLVAGPPERLDFYKNNVLPSLKALVHGLSPAATAPAAP